SYFLRDVFRQVLYPDADVAGRSPRLIARQRMRTYLVAAALLALAVGIGAMPTYAWANDRGFLSETQHVLDEARPLLVERSDTPIAPSAFASLRERDVTLAEHHEDGPPWTYRFGMYQDSVYEPVHTSYLHVID